MKQTFSISSSVVDQDLNNIAQYNDILSYSIFVRNNSDREGIVNVQDLLVDDAFLNADISYVGSENAQEFLELENNLVGLNIQSNETAIVKFDVKLDFVSNELINQNVDGVIKSNTNIINSDVDLCQEWALKNHCNAVSEIDYTTEKDCDGLKDWDEDVNQNGVVDD